MDKEKILRDIAEKKARLEALKAKRAQRNAGKTGAGGAKERLAARRKEREAKKAGGAVASGGRGGGLSSNIDNLIGAAPAAEAGSMGKKTPDDSIHNIASVTPETYNKGIQCSIIGGSDNEKRTQAMQQQLEAQKIALQEEEEKMKIFKEQLKKDKLKYDKITDTAAVEKKELTNIEVRRIETSNDFQGFFKTASKVVERALSFSYDFTIDYLADGGEAEESKDEKIVRKTKLLDEKKTGSRAITSIAWSSKFKELVLSSYAGQDDPMSLEPDGTVLVWNMNSPNRPEYNFYCNSAVLVAKFHPTNPKLLVGGCRSGQVVVWDTRAKKTPIDRTSLSRGHTYPVYALACTEDSSLISVSTDGLLCQWNDSNLHDPANEIDLNAVLKESAEKESVTTDEITTTAFDFAGDSNHVILSSDEGRVYKASISDGKGIVDTVDAHDAPITNIHSHPTQKDTPGEITDLYLTSSYDWTCKLWSNKANKCLYTFESARDYVFDVQWSTSHPAVFACGDGTGKLDVWNLVVDTEIPDYSVQVEKDKGAISKISWSQDGALLACGMSTGSVHVFDVKEELYNASNEDSDRFYSKMIHATD